MVKCQMSLTFFNCKFFSYAPFLQILKITSTKMLTFENLTSHLPTLFVAVNLQFEAIHLLRSLQVEESH